MKSFIGVSTMADLEQALGQYLIYKSWLTRLEPERQLFMALGHKVAESIFDDISTRVLIKDYHLGLILVNTEQEEVVEWIS